MLFKKKKSWAPTLCFAGSYWPRSQPGNQVHSSSSRTDCSPHTLVMQDHQRSPASLGPGGQSWVESTQESHTDTRTGGASPGPILPQGPRSSSAAGTGHNSSCISGISGYFELKQKEKESVQCSRLPRLCQLAPHQGLLASIVRVKSNISVFISSGCCNNTDYVA